MYEDIPEALRESAPISKGLSRSKGLGVWLWAGLGFLLALGLALFLARGMFTPQTTSTSSTAANPAPAETTTLLGHLQYAEAPATSLSPIVSDGSIQLRQVAATKYLALAAAARQAGVELLPISGFRSIKDQEHLFFDIKAERGQVPRERAQVSAPPGYSEHHTGYAIDIGDASRPSANLETSFDQTPAYRWLKSNAAYYSFELSFPPGNAQGVSYEPWHWRFVGDQESLKTFYAARQSNAPKPTPAP